MGIFILLSYNQHPFLILLADIIIGIIFEPPSYYNFFLIIRIAPYTGVPKVN